MRRFHWKILVISIMAVFLVGWSSVRAQPLGQLTFKGTHNSYDQEATITSQIDNYNVWFVELDVCLDKSSPETLIVKHACGIAYPATSFENELKEITNATSTEERLTFIWLDYKDTHMVGLCCYDPGDQGEDGVIAADKVDFTVHKKFGTQLYTPGEWYQDNQIWPTYQELIARGKRYIVVFDDNDYKNYKANMFISAGSIDKMKEICPNWTKEDKGCYIAFINRPGPDTGGVTIDHDDQFLWRSYGLNDGNVWNEAASKGFNFLCTDEFNYRYTFKHVQAPSPIVLESDADYPIEEDFWEPLEGKPYGTYAWPFRSLNSMEWNLNNVDSPVIKGTRVHIHPGLYEEWGAISIGESDYVTGVTLEAVGGTATFQVQD